MNEAGGPNDAVWIRSLPHGRIPVSVVIELSGDWTIKFLVEPRPATLEIDGAMTKWGLHNHIVVSYTEA